MMGVVPNLGNVMRRRDFIKAIVGSAGVWPLAARAQQGAIRRTGVLMGFAESDHGAQSGVAGFREELRKLGWMEGRNIEIDTRWATADVESMQAFAKELVALQPDFILTSSTPATAAMVQQTRTIPIIFVMVSDPVGSGFVASLPRPGGNVTGFTAIEGLLGGKWVDLLKEIAPQVARVVLLFNPAMATYAEYYLHPFKAAAASLGVEAIVVPFGSGQPCVGYQEADHRHLGLLRARRERPRSRCAPEERDEVAAVQRYADLAGLFLLGDEPSLRAFFSTSRH
jgi:putative tryptophan/tyrosine transport system substrate-binding protein